MTLKRLSKVIHIYSLQILPVIKVPQYVNDLSTLHVSCSKLVFLCLSPYQMWLYSINHCITHSFFNNFHHLSNIWKVYHFDYCLIISFGNIFICTFIYVKFKCDLQIKSKADEKKESTFTKYGQHEHARIANIEAALKKIPGIWSEVKSLKMYASS